MTAHLVVWGFGIAIVLAIVARDAWKKRKQDSSDRYIAELRKTRGLREANRGR